MSIQETLKDYIVGLQHIGHVVPDLDEAVATFIAVYGIDEDDVRREPEDPDQEAATRFAFVSVGNTEFELIQPVTEEFRETLFESPSGGAGINHIAWRVSDIEACVNRLTVKGIRPGHVTPDGIVSFGNRKLVYLDPTDTHGMLIELIEIVSDGVIQSP
ncbi:MAG: VOC family protein [Woeseiaceae bacterium]